MALVSRVIIDSMDKINLKKGFVALALVLMVNAITLAVATGVFLRSISTSNSNFYEQKSIIAWATVSACGEYAVMKLSTTTSGWSYAGGESLSLGGETCYIYPTATSGTSRIIKASSTVSDFTRKILIEVATNTPAILINSWTEVADF